jgi:hypothetical protein
MNITWDMAASEDEAHNVKRWENITKCLTIMRYIIECEYFTEHSNLFSGSTIDQTHQTAFPGRNAIYCVSIVNCKLDCHVRWLLCPEGFDRKSILWFIRLVYFFPQNSSSLETESFGTHELSGFGSFQAGHDKTGFPEATLAFYSFIYLLIYLSIYLFIYFAYDEW